ncbi:hypothetical protein M3Y97_00557100 [Aphelenchoides bicaudatus]|nr:hypothetical protein M3Y97_00557100 [Aphelenchoides bicaudatus]
MSSSCSSIDPDFGDPLSDALIFDIEQFSDHINNLRVALDPTSYIPDGESKCVQVHAALSLVSSSVRDLLVRYPVFKTSQVLIPASQLVHSIKELNYDKLGQECVRTLQCIERLEAAVGNTLRLHVSGRSNSQTPSINSAKVASTLGRKLNKQTSVISNIQSNGSTGSTPALQNGTLRRNRIQRRHSTFQPKVNASSLDTDSDSNVMRELLARHEDGLEIAMDRTKSWSNYVKVLLNYGRSRLAMEREHARNLLKLSEQTKSTLNADPNNNLPLVQIFEQLMDKSTEFANRTEQTITILNQRFINSLENRQKEHDAKRRKLKNDWTKSRKQRDLCVEELKRARQTLNSKEGGYLKARDSTLRHANSAPFNGSVDTNRKLKELEKLKRTEEGAFNRKIDAENEVWKLERELEIRQSELDQLRVFIIGELFDLIRSSDLTLCASSHHFVKAFTELWANQPVEYEHLGNAIRGCAAGSEFMSFLQSIQNRSISSSSLLRGSSSTNEKEDELQGLSNAASSTSESVPCRRRNALNAEEHNAWIAETTQRRQKKSVTRLFDQSLSTLEQSDAAKTHNLVRTKQVTKCSSCDHLVIFDAVKCSKCPIVVHKKCLPKLAITCGPNAHRLATDSNSRRMSIFGVPLKGHLEAQHRVIPLIVEKCVDELQKRGMNCKGIYRTCGVKSKIEQICVSFEQAGHEVEVDLSDVHPMNLASVVKLYLRKLPEPLMSYELYREWIDFDLQLEKQALVAKLRDLCERLPQQNLDTLRFLLLHLKRVTWFEMENLMTAANLAAVISPSLIWHHASTGPSTPASFSSASTVAISSHSSLITDAHQQTKVVELLIQYAFEIFELDKQDDWTEFFEKYPDVTEPNECLDPAAEAKLNYSAKILADEDDLDEEDYFDEIEQSSSQLPPTPDLLARNKAESSSDDLSGTGTSPRFLKNASHLERQRLGKQRSFTTSILVSPQADRKTALPHKQHSMDDQKPPDPYKHKVLQSGEVTVDKTKDQYFLPNYNHQSNNERPHQKPPNGFKSESLDRRRFDSTNLNGYDSNDASDSKADPEKFSLQNHGIIFTGNDSYV